MDIVRNALLTIGGCTVLLVFMWAVDKAVMAVSSVRRDAKAWRESQKRR